MKIGLEIEINSNDYSALFKALSDNNIDYTFSANNKESSSELIIIKPERTTEGLELNIPPDYNNLSLLLSVIEPYVYFVDNAALHIHVSDASINEETLDDFFTYYRNNESAIIEEAKVANVYINLNASLKELQYYNYKHRRRVNLNIYRAFKAHGTIEHRIYKATLDINKINWCIEQTLKIARMEPYSNVFTS